ncbi:hypothetical protein [Spirosoma areae]
MITSLYRHTMAAVSVKLNHNSLLNGLIIGMPLIWVMLAWNSLPTLSFGPIWWRLS